jgi:hypothetical protein
MLVQRKKSFTKGDVDRRSDFSPARSKVAQLKDPALSWVAESEKEPTAEENQEHDF